MRTRRSLLYSRSLQPPPAHAGRQDRSGRHDCDANVITTDFADFGFDVDVGTLFQTPEEVARRTIENDVHVIGISTQSGGHKTRVPAFIAELEKTGVGDIVVTVGGIIPSEDYKMLEASGVKPIFGPHLLHGVGDLTDAGADAGGFGTERL